MTLRSPQSLDPRKEKEIRQTLAELRQLEDQGYFEGVVEREPGPADLRVPGAADWSKGGGTAGRWATFHRKVSQLRPMDAPAGPALAQFMTQFSIKERTEAHKQETARKFAEASGQVKYLFGKILRGEVTSSAIVRSIVGNFMDTFVKDRNLLLNLSALPYSGNDYLYDHALKLCLLSLSIASAAGYSRTQAIDIAQGALLADVGMLLVPERIRHKRGKLTQPEIFEMQKHPILGLGLLEPVHGLSESILIIPYQHHERVGGTGYPDKRSGNLVSKFSRIVGVADVFTALINKRTYREALTPYQAMVALLSMGGQGMLDSEQIRNFLRTLSIFPLGSLVRLASGRVAKVVAPNADEFTKPLLSVLTTEDGAPLAKDRIYQVDLSLDPREKIVEALSAGAIRNAPLDGF
jgi:HD-GYP domain-containing protein (c-di-GMP phosphodiesterase class II)